MSATDGHRSVFQPGPTLRASRTASVLRGTASPLTGTAAGDTRIVREIMEKIDKCTLGMEEALFSRRRLRPKTRKGTGGVELPGGVLQVPAGARGRRRGRGSPRSDAAFSRPGAGAVAWCSRPPFLLAGVPGGGSAAARCACL